jgi:tetratricopeptide (TPR) repeat protein
MPTVDPICPHCQAHLPASAPDDPGAASCPQCGRPTVATPVPAGRTAGPKRRAGGRARVGVLALAVIGAAVALSYRNIEEELRHAFPPAPAVAAPTPPTPRAALDGAAHSRLVVLRGQGGDAGPVVALGRPLATNDYAKIKETDPGILFRELIRQAVLIAARDELGLATHDEVVGDPIPDARGPATAEVVSVFVPAPGTSLVQVLRGEGEKAGAICRRDLGPKPKDFSYPAGLVTAAEALSRSEFPAALRKLGLIGKPNATRDGGDVPEAVEGRLGRLGFTGPLAAVRDLHAAIRADGETPARIGALARGYALLGVLTEFHWHPAHKAYKARALLYAQRLVARDPKSPWGLWHRAFAEALTGMHKDALDDLAAAKALAGAEGATKPPAWVDLIDASCRYDAGRLRVADGPHADLAALLRMMALEYPSVTAAALRAARDVLARDPECFRAHDQMCQVGGVSNLHIATTYGPQVLDQMVPRAIRQMEGLPATVGEAIDRQVGEVALAEALSRAGAVGADGGEPSWGALAQMIRETRFVHVARRLHFMRYMWSVPTGEFWDESHLSVAAHRYRPYLQWLALPSEEEARTFAEFAEKLDVSDLEVTAMPMVKELEQAGHSRGQHLFGSMAAAHADELARDYSTWMLYYMRQPEEYARRTHALLAISPHSPFGMNQMIHADWAWAEPRVAGWLAQGGDSVALLGGLAWRYTELGRLDEAQPLLERYIRLSPDAWGYKTLAGNYKSLGDLARWQATLDDYLANVEDFALDHAQVRVDIANHFMKEKEWARAQPYAEAAAQSWAHWAMNCAIRCYTAMEDWDRAELWTRRVAERYPGPETWAVWYLFCKQTGRGDVESARAWTDQFLAALGDRTGIADPLAVGYFRWLAGETEEARGVFTTVKETKVLAASVALAMIADDLGEAARRDELLEEIGNRPPDEGPKTIRICKLFRDALAKGDGAKLDLVEVNFILQNIPTERRGNTEFFVGWFLKNRGQADDARAYLRNCAESPTTYVWMRAMAADALRSPPLAPRPAGAGPPASD